MICIFLQRSVFASFEVGAAANENWLVDWLQWMVHKQMDQEVKAALQKKGYYVSGDALIYLTNSSGNLDAYAVLPKHQIKGI